MKRHSIVVTADLVDAVEAGLAQRYDVRKLSLKALGADGFLAGIGGARAIVVSPGDPVDAALIERLPAELGLIASYSTGLDHIDVEAARRRGILVSNTPDVLTDATADIAIFLILGTVRGAARASSIIRSGGWDGWTPAQIFGRDLRGLSLGILGGGRIGAATALRAQAFGMAINYHSRRQNPKLGALGAAFYPDLHRFLKSSDIVSLHIPSTPETRRIIDADAIDAMREGGFLINTARGDLVDDDAVVAALRNGKLSGVGLDVFNDEPDFDRRYLECPNALLLPHIGSATHETRLAMGRSVIASLDAFFGTSL